MRTSRRLELTEAGQSYVAACREILEQVDEAERLAAGEYAAPKGGIVVTAPIVFGRLHVLPVLIDFLDAFPEIDVRLVQTDRLTNFIEDRVDVALRIGPLPDSGLFATRVGAVERVTCASPDYLARTGHVPADPRDLVHNSCISFQGLYAPDKWTYFADRKTVSVDVRSRLVVDTAEAAIDAAVMGLGVTRVLSYQIADRLCDGSLVTILDNFRPQSWPVHIVYASQGLLPLKIRAFIDFAPERLRRRLGGI